MPDQPKNLALDVDLQGGVVPISRAASALAALLKRARERQQPIIVTQKGYPAGVLLPIDIFVALRAQAEAAAGAAPTQEESEEATTGESDASPETPVEATGDGPDAEAAPPTPRRRGGRRKHAEES